MTGHVQVEKMGSIRCNLFQYCHCVVSFDSFNDFWGLMRFQSLLDGIVSSRCQNVLERVQRNMFFWLGENPKRPCLVEEMLASEGVPSLNPYSSAGLLRSDMNQKNT